LITQDRKHYQNRVEAAAEIDIPNIAVVEMIWRWATERCGFVAGVIKHELGSVDADDLEASPGEREGVVAGSTTQVQNAGDFSLAIRAKHPLDQVALGFVVFVGVKLVIRFRVV